MFQLLLLERVQKSNVKCYNNLFEVYGPYKQTMAKNQKLYFKTKSQTLKIRLAAARCQSSTKRYSRDFMHWSTLDLLTREVSIQKYMSQAFPGMDRVRCLRQDSNGFREGSEGTWLHRLE